MTAVSNAVSVRPEFVTPPAAVRIAGVCVPGLAKPGAVKRIDEIDEYVAGHVRRPGDGDEVVGRRLQVEIHAVDARRGLGEIAGDVGRVDVLVKARRYQPFVGQHVEWRGERTEPDDRAGIEDAGRLVVDGVLALRQVDGPIHAPGAYDRIRRQARPLRRSPGCPSLVARIAVVGQKIGRAADETDGVRGFVAEARRSPGAHAADDGDAVGDRHRRYWAAAARRVG